MSVKYKYIFRGTTVNFEGGHSSKKYHFTCTSQHPAIALLFAMVCAKEYPETSVIYVAVMEKVRHLITEPNVFKRQEQEVVFQVLPLEFCKLSEGYVHFSEMQQILSKMGYKVDEIMRIDKLSEFCAKVGKMSVKDIEKVVQEIKNMIKPA